jgi:hypothetical protein
VVQVKNAGGILHSSLKDMTRELTGVSKLIAARRPGLEGAESELAMAAYLGSLKASAGLVGDGDG